MIQLENDHLEFSFPKADLELRRHAAKHADACLTRILAEPRPDAVAKLHQHREYRRANAKNQRNAEQQLLAVRDDAIRAAFERKTESIVPKNACSLRVNFQRTLRLPDDGKVYPLPAGLGSFPLCHVDDFGERAPESWAKRGGVAMPMYQSEALWISFRGWTWPMAVQIAAGKINAATGKPWSSGLARGPQNYLVTPEQPWLDGFAVEKGVIRQFVAMPLGEGYSVEEQLTGEAEFGGLQFQVFPMKAEACFLKRFQNEFPTELSDLFDELRLFPLETTGAHRLCCMESMAYPSAAAPGGSEMGLGAGGQMRQEIYRDPHHLDDWDRDHFSRCFVHLSNALTWRAITGGAPPHPPITAIEYARARVPWFDHYRSDLDAIEGSSELAGVKTVQQIHKKKTGAQLVGEAKIEPGDPVATGPAKRPRNVVREWLAS